MKLWLPIVCIMGSFVVGCDGCGGAPSVSHDAPPLSVPTEPPASVPAEAAEDPAPQQVPETPIVSDPVDEDSSSEETFAAPSPETSQRVYWTGLGTHVGRALASQVASVAIAGMTAIVSRFIRHDANHRGIVPIVAFFNVAQSAIQVGKYFLVGESPYVGPLPAGTFFDSVEEYNAFQKGREDGEIIAITASGILSVAMLYSGWDWFKQSIPSTGPVAGAPTPPPTCRQLVVYHPPASTVSLVVPAEQVWALPYEWFFQLASGVPPDPRKEWKLIPYHPGGAVPAWPVPVSDGIDDDSVTPEPVTPPPADDDAAADGGSSGDPVTPPRASTRSSASGSPRSGVTPTKPSSASTSPRTPQRMGRALPVATDNSVEARSRSQWNAKLLENRFRTKQERSNYVALVTTDLKEQLTRISSENLPRLRRLYPWLFAEYDACFPQVTI